jgi:signal transduction histidine kinase/ActR/RegA family two-component response regulator
VSAPIGQLADAARTLRVRRGEQTALPPIHAGEDEIGDLVRAFDDMLRRVQEATAEREQLLAREREASRLKDEFLAAVSHELRTPLNAILGWIQILTTTDPNEQTIAKAIASIARNARTQTRVIEDLVEISRIVTGKLDLRYAPVDLREVIESAVDVVQPTMQAKHITLTQEVPSEVCLVNGDRDRLHQVVWNLLSNAAKFTPAGGAINVSLRLEDAVFEIRIADSGIGIAPEFLPHVFDRFRQADGSMTREHGGLGLGLAIAKELVDMHGGTIQAASDGKGRGAAFVVRLPQLAGLRARDAVRIGSDRNVTAPLAGLGILAVDDNADALDVLAASLSNRGAVVRIAASGMEALAQWDRQPADVLICDLAMPIIDGFEVLREIRKRDDPAGRRTVAIAVTAHASDDFQARTRAAGFDAHVTKPYEFSELEQSILAALQRV